MIDIAKQTIDFYLKNFKTPKIEDLDIKDSSLLENNASLFVTIYKNGDIRWASGNIKELKNSTAEEITINTINAISADPRFEKIKPEEASDLKIRIDLISSRNILQDKEILSVDPVKFWIIALKKDYSNIACILPNINGSLLTWEDFIPVLKSKLNSKDFVESDHILYKIETQVFDNFNAK